MPDRMMFDDWVEDEACGDWAYICKIHVKIYELEGLEESPTEGAICGIDGCYNLADFYIPLDEEENDEHC